jgi:hypothetical protein
VLRSDKLRKLLPSKFVILTIDDINFLLLLISMAERVVSTCEKRYYKRPITKSRRKKLTDSYFEQHSFL